MSTQGNIFPPAYRPSLGDRVGLGIFIFAGLALTVSTAVFAAIRITEVLGPGATPVEVNFAALPAEIPAGDRGMGLEVTSGIIRVRDLSTASLFAGIAGPALTTLVTATIAFCLIVLAVSIMRGHIFNKRNSRLVVTAGITGLLGFAAVNLFNTMLANETLALISGNEVESIVFSVQPGTYLLAAFVIALVSSVFVIGERMQRDTEGLV